MHLKRQEVPKSWPIPRKGTKFVVRTGFDPEKGVPMLVVLRDILNLAQTRKEVKTVLNMKDVLLNQSPIKDERHPALIYDVVTIVPAKKSYKIILSEKGKFDAVEIKENEARKKISKIVNKKMMSGKKMQLNLFDGRNILSDIKCKVNDSVVINFETKKVEKCIELKEKSKVEIFGGKHAGKRGIVEKLDKEKKMAEVAFGDIKTEVLIKQIIVVE